MAHLSYPDEDLPRIGLDFDDFVAHGLYILDDRRAAIEAQDERRRRKLDRRLASFVLAGRATYEEEDEEDSGSDEDDEDDDGPIEPDVQRRVFLDALANLDPVQAELCTISRDYDSVIGYSTDLPYRRAVAIELLPNLRRDTLTDDIHLCYPMRQENGTTKNIRFNDIANFGIGRASPRHTIRLFLPSLYQKGVKPSISPETFESIYINAIKPSVLELQLERVTYWPPSYKNIYTMARGAAGRFHHPTVDIPAHLLPEFSRGVIRRLETHCNLPGAFFLHEYRGTKGQAPHDPDDAAQRQASLDAVLTDFLPDVAKRPTFYIDVALEFNATDYALLWGQGAHARVLSHALQISLLDARALLAVPTRYFPDTTAQLDDIAGFRYKPTLEMQRRTGVAYVQAYSTEKAATYQVHDGGPFRRKYASNVYPKMVGALLSDCQRISSVFHECGINSQAANARLEVRVPITEALQHLKYDPASESDNEALEEIIRDTIVGYPAHTWWSFKHLRSVAIYICLEIMTHQSLELRAETASLMLAAALIYMLNALLARPATERAHCLLIDTCSLHVSVTAQNGRVSWEPTTFERGLYFVCAIVFDPTQLRIPKSRQDGLDPYALANVYMETSLLLVRQQFFTDSVLLDKATPTPFRVHNKSRRLRDVDLIFDLDDDEGPDFGLDAKGVVIPLKRVRRRGPDVDPLKRDDDEIGDELDQLTTDQLLRKVWRNFPHNVMAKAPNHKKRSLGSHYLGQNQDVDTPICVDYFQTLDFRGSFSQVHTRLLLPEQWKSLQFDRYFPSNPQPTLPGQMQNLPYMPYYKIWTLKIMNRVTGPAKTLILTAVEREFNKLWWVPHTESDRVWSTKSQNKAGWRSFPTGTSHHTGICLAINPHMCKRNYKVKVGRLPEPRDDGLDSEHEDESNDGLLYTFSNLSIFSV